MLGYAGRERGDTLIEVMFATAVLAFLIVLSISIMNAGTLQAERAVEGTFVRQSIDSQTELLRYVRDAYVNKDAGAAAVWSNIASRRVETGSVMPFSDLAGSDCTPRGQSFWMKAEGGTVSVQTGFSAPATFAAPGQGMWITAASNTPNANYLDFYLYACWDSTVGDSKATSGTIVRLYAPAA